MPSSNTAVQPDRVDVRGPRFAAWVTTAVLVLALVVSAASPPAAAVILGVQAVIFAIGAVGGPRRHPYGRVFASRRGAPAGTGQGARTGRTAEVRPTRRSDLRGRRRYGIRRRRLPGRRHRHRVRAGGRLPERGLRHLPGLPALPAGRAHAAHVPHNLPSSEAIERNPPHGTLRRPGLRGLG